MAAPAAAPAVLPALPAPATPHILTRVVLPGSDPTLDYVAPPAGAAVVKGLPRLGWIDASSAIAGAQAVPFLSLAGWACRPAFIESGTAGEAAMRALAEVTATFSLAFVGRCLDALEGLGVFAVALDHDAEYDDKLVPALARVPSPSPFALQAGELFEANAFFVAPVAGVAGVAGVRGRVGRGRAGQRGHVAPIVAVAAVAPVAAIAGRNPAALEWWSRVSIGDSLQAGEIYPLINMLQPCSTRPTRPRLFRRRLRRRRSIYHHW